MVNVNCAVSGCSTNARANKELSWHRIPSDRRLESWLKFCQRPDLMGRTKEQLKNCYICSLHFEPWMFKNGGKKQSLYGSAVPTLLNRPGEDGATGSSFAIKTEKEDESSVVVKQEIEDAFSEHEEDIEQQLENRKRQKEMNAAAIEAKRVKVEEKEAVPVIITNPVPPVNPAKFIPPKVIVEVNKDDDVFPVDFMRTVLNSQEEILKVLKSQVLLVDPDRDLLTFLRLLGVKLSRLNKENRRMMENKILDLLETR